jgi:signal transduction histidine kinase
VRTALTSLHARLILLVLVTILPATGLILYTAADGRRLAAERSHAEALRLTRMAALEQAQVFEGARQLLIGLGQAPDVLARDGAACSAHLADILKQFSVYTALAVATPQGDVFCTGTPLSSPVSFKDRLYFQRALTTRGFAISEYLIGRISGRPVIAVAHAAVDKSNTVRAVVIAGIGLQWLNHLATDAHLPKDSTLTVLDDKAVVLAQYPDTGEWIGKVVQESPLFKAIVADHQEGEVEAVGLDGVSRLYAFSRLNTSPDSGDVYISVGIPRSVVFAAANRILARNLIGLGIVLIVALGAARIIASRLVLRRVETLVASTKRLETGDLSARAGGPYGRGELDQLARSFDDMAAALERQREALIKSERLAALGRLAAGIGHELKNPLSVIASRVRMLQSYIAKGQIATSDLLSRNLGGLDSASQRMQDIMKGLSTYAKPSKPEPTRLSMGELLSATEELVEYEGRKRDVKITVDAPVPMPTVLGDRSQLMQVLVNLSMNAIEAMDKGGDLRLRARVHDNGAAVRTEIEDTGPGMSPEALAKIWDPFYTTKAEGTGLGLSIVRGIVADHEGATLDVKSEPGRGTTFILTMPIASGS